MNARGWRELVLAAVSLDRAGDARMLNRLARLLEEQDLARQALRDKGIAWVGRSLLESIADCEAR